MQKPIQIGITGGIGSGKSLVCKIFGVLGVPAYDADSRAKNLMTTDGILIDQIKKEFGSLSYDVKGGLNREFLSATVFSKQDKLKQLNALVHPRVAVDYKQWVEEHEGNKYVLKEAALLFESGSYKELDKIIVVTAPKEIRIERVLARDNHRTKEDVEKIIQNQISEEEKEAKANFIIRNNESELIVPQVVDLHKRFNSMN
ncbi:MAG TPA: dephospho-CoA kinase [Cyclobacteriaceae bacterium]|nr:dephospho-CoA kinase [Cyclobacteriaceae bacterium]